MRALHQVRGRQGLLCSSAARSCQVRAAAPPLTVEAPCAGSATSSQALQKQWKAQTKQLTDRSKAVGKIAKKVWLVCLVPDRLYGC